MKNKRTKRQHIIPRSYLKRFAVDDKVYVHNFQKNTTYINNIADVACIDDFYTVKTKDNDLDDCVESGFAEIEGKTNPIIEDIVNTKKIPEGDDKALLCNYIALMFTRGLLFRQILHETYEHLILELCDKMMSDEDVFNEAMSSVKATSGEFEDISFEEAKKIRGKIDVTVDIPRTYYVKEMMLLAAPLVNTFYGMNFNLLYIPVYSDAKYITSDMPFVEMTNGKERKPWREYPEAEIYFPLSSTVCLMMDWNSKSTVRKDKRGQVSFLNYYLADKSVYIAISQEENFIWRYGDITIHNCSEKIVNMLSKQKKDRHATTQSTGKIMQSKPMGDVNILKGRDE